MPKFKYTGHKEAKGFGGKIWPKGQALEETDPKRVAKLRRLTEHFAEVTPLSHYATESTTDAPVKKKRGRPRKIVTE